MTIKPIQTFYCGYHFRSRLEARWAVMFNALGVEWLYEHEGYETASGVWYLPDFYFPDWGCWGEVKPTTFTKEEYNKAVGLPGGCLLLDSSVPRLDIGYYCAGFSTLHLNEVESYDEYLSGKEWGRVLLEQSQYKGRLWHLFGEGPEVYSIDLAPQLIAMAARFEHGATT